MAILRGQKTNYDCGPTCFANALNMLGYDIKIDQANKLCNLTKHGTDSDDLIKAFERYGFEGREKVHYNADKAWEWLQTDTAQGLPVILSVDTDTHWILVLRAGKNRVQILDPDDDGPTRISRKKLMERWQHFHDRRMKPMMHGLAFEPFKDKSIKAVTMRASFLATVDVR